MSPIFFYTTDEFRDWLTEYHNKEDEVYVGMYKVKTKKLSIKLMEALDVAICFGWIDSRVNSIDSESYCYRFTPRKTKSNWSEANIKKYKALSKQGLMHESGHASYQNRKKIMQYSKDIKSEHKELFLEARDYLLSYDEIKETKKERITTYATKDGGICHLRTMPHGIDIGFLKGAKMQDKFERLTGNGKAIRVLSLNELEVKTLEYYMHQALQINKNKI